MSMKVACIQSSYIPWKGYIDIIREVDIFVFLDDVQMTLRDWRSRNKIKTPRQTEWLTVPVRGGRNQLVCEVNIVANDWQKQHLKAIQYNYNRAPFFKDYEPILNWLYGQPHSNLSQFNRHGIMMICELLGIKTKFMNSVDLGVTGTKDDRLINICNRLGATTYLSGPSARSYIDGEKFARAGIELLYKDYAGYPEYPQLFPPFDHFVTVLDLLFNCGAESPYYIWGWREASLL